MRATQQINATGTYNDGSTKDLTGSASWTTSDQRCATVSKGGLVTAAATIANPPGTATITAASGTLTATSTITVNTGPLTAIAIKPPLPIRRPDDRYLHRDGDIYRERQQQDITSQVTWSSNNTAVITTITNGSGAVLSTATSGSTTNLTATLNGINSNTLTITVQ